MSWKENLKSKIYLNFHIKSITSDTIDSFTKPVGDGSVRKTHNQFGNAILYEPCNMAHITGNNISFICSTQ